MSNQPQDNLPDDMSFLNEPEVEVMPGVYMTQYGKNKPTNTTNNNNNNNNQENQLPPTEGQTTVPQDQEQLIADMVMSEGDKAALEAELLALQSQLQTLQFRITTNQKIISAGETGSKMTLAERTGLTGIHLLEQIDMRIDQITKHHLHLVQSQKQLEDLLVTEDQDIIDAFEENKAVLSEQVERINGLKVERRQVLAELGPHYAEIEDVEAISAKEVKNVVVGGGDVGDVVAPVVAVPSTKSTITRDEDEEKNAGGDDKAGFWL